MHGLALIPRRASRLVAWLLIGLVPLQAVAIGVLTSAGPAHVHRTAPSESRVLVDFRRESAPAAARITHVASPFGHFHAGAAPLRHYHSHDDTSVVLPDGGPSAQGGDSDATSVNPSLAGFATLLPSPIAWIVPLRRDVRASCVTWPSLTHDPEPLERPPRAG